MSQKAFTMIFYIVPEDLDDVEQPNAYGIHKSIEDIKQSDIADTFPLPGKYIFRYRYKFQNNLVWMDINSNSPKIPQFNGKIFIKATRISLNDELNKTTSQQRVSQIQPKETQIPVENAQQNINIKEKQSNKVNSSAFVEPVQKVKSLVKENISNENYSQKQTDLLQNYESKPSNITTQQNSLYQTNLLDMDDLVGSSKKVEQKQKQEDNLWDF